MGKAKSRRVSGKRKEAAVDAPPPAPTNNPSGAEKAEGSKGNLMEQHPALERVDVGSILSQAEQLLASGDVGNFENLVHALESHRQQYLEIERQSATIVRQLEQEFTSF